MASKFADSARGSTRILLLLLIFGLVVLGVFYAWPLLTRPSINHLTDQALNAETPEARLEAARLLAQREQNGVEAMRTVVGESSDQNVVSICILGLSRQMDQSEPYTVGVPT